MPRPAPIESRNSPTLADGVRLRDLIDFNKREVAMRVLGDPEIYRLELQRVFARSWIALGHVAEIPNAGDYVKRAIGQDQVIVARGRDGEISVLLNACSHRGMEICWADQGNQASFKCPYHGWVFDHAGNLMGAPFEKEMYGDWDKSQYGLRKARVGLYHGRIFGNFDHNAMPLDEWLGEAAYYLDLPYAGLEPDLEVCQAPRRFRVESNWKLPADNNSGDTYHGASLHYSLFELGMSPDMSSRRPTTLKVSTSMGHGLVGFSRNVMTGGPDPERPAVDDYTYTCVLFPGSFGLGGGNERTMPGPDGEPLLMVSTGGVVPLGPNSFEMWTGALIDKRAPEPLKQAMRNAIILDLGGADDLAAWPSVQVASKGEIGAAQPIRYNARSTPSRPAGWAGPGDVYVGAGADDNQWNFWRRWYDMMTIDEA